MIQIKCGTCGTSKGYKTSADGAISLPASEEARLVFRGVAAYATRPIIDKPSAEAPDTPPAPPPGGEEEPGTSQGTPGADPAAEEAAGGEEDGSADAEVTKLERMQKVDLEQMAADMGLDVSGAKTKHDLAVLIVAAGEPEYGEAPPDLGAGDIVQ